MSPPVVGKVADANWLKVGRYSCFSSTVAELAVLDIVIAARLSAVPVFWVFALTFMMVFPVPVVGE